MSMFEKFKESKKVMTTKMEQANKMAEEAAGEFVDSIKSLAKDASEEDLKSILESDDEMIDDMDKMAVIAAFAESHEAGGFAIIGFKK